MVFKCLLDNESGQLALQSPAHFVLTQTSLNEMGQKRMRKEVKKDRLGGVISHLQVQNYTPPSPHPHTHTPVLQMKEGGLGSEYVFMLITA